VRWRACRLLLERLLLAVLPSALRSQSTCLRRALRIRPADRDAVLQIERCSDRATASCDRPRPEQAGQQERILMPFRQVLDGDAVMETPALESMAATLLIVSLGVLSALAAVGAVLSLKIARRRRAARMPAASQLDTGVPATPMSSSQARRWIRRYASTAAALAIALLIAAATLLH
jgi:hypothetical protein